MECPFPGTPRGPSLRAGRDEGDKMNTIVVGYDDTEPAKRALARAAEFAQTFKTKVVVTSVARLLVPGPRGMGGIDPVDPLELHEEQLEHAKAYLAERNIVPPRL